MSDLPNASEPEGRWVVGGELVAARSPLEERLCALWAELLGVGAVGVEDDFFELGGHSLLVAQLRYRLRELFGVDLPVRVLFDHPTVAGLADAVEHASGASGEPAAPTLVPLPRPAVVPLSFGQQRLWFLDRLVPGNAFYNVCDAVRLTGALDVGALERAVGEVVARHEVLRTRFVDSDGRPRQVVEDPWTPAPALLDVSGYGGDVESLAREIVGGEGARPFDLEHGRLLRAGLVRLGEREHVLWFVTHHIVFDGWSWEVLVGEVAALYRASVEGRSSPLEPLPVQYADFAVWQRRWLEGELLEGQLAYWRETLRGAPLVLELPADRARPAMPTYRGASVSRGLGRELSEALKDLARREGVTPFMALTAVFELLLSRHGAGDDVLVGVPAAGRSWAEVEHTIGFFVNTLVLRGDLSGDPTFSELLGRVREASLGAYAHQDLPFDRLVEELQPVRDLSRHPLVQVMFQLIEPGPLDPRAEGRDGPAGELAAVGLRVEAVAGWQAGRARFDMDWAVRDVDGELVAGVSYATDLFDEVTAMGMVEGFVQLIGAAVAEPWRSVGELSLRDEVPDRRAEEPVAEQAAGAFVAPRTAVEECLCGVWRELLGVDAVGVEDDFFELGGHSLLVVQLRYRVRKLLGVELSVRALFDHPTVAALAELLEAEAAAEVPRAPAAPPLAPVSRPEVVPLSFGQQRLWFLDRLVPGNAFYNVCDAVRLTGPLDVRALERALGEVVARHEVLRTRFASVGGRPRQIVHEPWTSSLPLVDVSGEDGDLASRVREIVGGEGARPFDLERDRLVRAGLVRLGEREHVLWFVTHHIVFDGWSWDVWLDEVAALYRAGVEGRSSPLGAPPLQYADFAVWQRGSLDRELLDGQLAYWREQLRGAPLALELPTDRPRPAMPTYRGATVTFRIGKEATDALRELARSEGVTLFMVLTAVFELLLSRYGAGDDVVVGVPAAGRSWAEVERTIGFFVNTLVLRGDLSGDPSFRELLARVRAASLDAYAHQYLPFDRLVDELQPVRDVSRHPLVQVMLQLVESGRLDRQAGPAAELGAAGMGVEAFTGCSTGRARFDMEWSARELDGELTINVTYATDLFDEATVARMGEHFARLVDAAVAEPGRAVGELSLLREAERERVLVEWSGSVGEVPDRRVHELVAEQAARSPEAIAVRHGDREIGYGELDRRANQLAWHLRSLGVGRETLVGICVSRSVELVVGVLGILKAGGAYVPVDPSYPAERVAFMLADAGARVVVSDSASARVLPASDAPVVSLDRDRPLIAEQPVTTPPPLATADSLAYVIYTSGSTGTPKGVMVEHRGLTNLACHQSALFDVGPGDRVLQFASLSTDPCLWEILIALLHGATLCLPHAEPHDPHVWRELGITIAALPASVLRTVDPRRVPSLRTIVVGGERCPRELASRWARGRRLFNAYGPTEASIVATIAELDADVEGEPPIGRPIGNVTCFVLDEGLRPLPVGVAGELCIGGVGVARGYLGRAELTTERFVDAPFGGGRLYRSGDVARWRGDSRLEFLGRTDEQVKVRGYRVEPGEVEAALATHAGVREAAVVAREDVAGDRRLVAYAVVEDGVDGEALRSWLRGRLPEFMVPSRVALLERLPSTPSGKVDRRALPAPEGPLRGGASVAPRTAVEECLCGVWRELLGVDAVGVEDDFFELGGHSLLVAEMMARVQEAFAVELSLRVLFEGATVGALAAAVEAARA